MDGAVTVVKQLCIVFITINYLFIIIKEDTLDRDNLWYLLFMVSMFTLIRLNKVLLLLRLLLMALITVKGPVVQMHGIHKTKTLHNTQHF